MKDFFKPEMEILEMKNRVSEMKNIHWMGLTADSTLNFKTQQQKNIQNEAQREKKYREQ